MREKKFRAYVEAGIIEGRPAEMYEVSRIDLGINGIVSAELFSPKYETFHMLEAKWFKIMEFIGRKDENGKEIWEGDILSPKEDLSGWGNQVVGWEEEGAGFSPGEELQFEECEAVIGNIYETPELRGGVHQGVKAEEGE